MRMCKWWHEWTILAVALQWAMLTGREWAAAQAPASGGCAQVGLVRPLMCCMTFFRSMPCLRDTFWVTSAAIFEMSFDFPSSLCNKLKWRTEELRKTPKKRVIWDVVFLSGAHLLCVLASFFSQAPLLVLASDSYFSCSLIRNSKTASVEHE